MSDRQYSGWANYETWAVALWLGNELATYEELRVLTQRARSKEDLASSVKSFVEEMTSLDEASLRADLLSAAVAEVDWYELADHYWEDFVEGEELQ